MSILYEYETQDLNDSPSLLFIKFWSLSVWIKIILLIFKTEGRKKLPSSSLWLLGDLTALASCKLCLQGRPQQEARGQTEGALPNREGHFYAHAASKDLTQSVGLSSPSTKWRKGKDGSWKQSFRIQLQLLKASWSAWVSHSEHWDPLACRALTLRTSLGSGNTDTWSNEKHSLGDF